MTPTALLALDLDGTLLDAAGQPAPGLISELLGWSEAGAHVAVITARGGKTPLINGWPLHSVSRCYGAWLQTADTVRWSRTLPPATLQMAMARLNRWELNTSGGGTILVTEDPRDLLRSSDPSFAAQWREARGVLKLAHGQPDAARLDEVQAQWSLLPGVKVIRERRDRLALVRADACKGSAVQALAAQLGVPRGRIIVAGDGSADAAMLPHAGTFIRVGNHPALAGATHHVPAPQDLPGLLGALRAERLFTLQGQRGT
ncbi:HAD hydrolase family protein [Deinococcus sp. JMULE3]|uniref:HAD family hydrolase n=1 Tax=Deinococcus sp. JMULE3 TaxID=2518341 RepID=UPI0015764338